MFHNIPSAILDQMRRLESIDARDRLDGTPRSHRLRQISPDTGRFLALLAASAPPGEVLEVGASAGYSALWLALACRQRGDRLTTFEMLDNKVALARETFRLAQVEDVVALVHADARMRLPAYRQIAFCFLDSEKELYAPIFDQVVPHLLPGGYFTADNVASHREELQPFLDRALADARLDSVVVPIGKGVLVCRKV
jgi:predicted O-methyltransferase YrrM